MLVLGAMACVLGASACDTSIETTASVDNTTASKQDTTDTSVFICENTSGSRFEFTVRRGSRQLALWLPFEFERPYLVLGLSRDDPQEYRGRDVVVRLRGQSADLAVGAQRFSDCIEDAVRSAWEHAKLSGVDYRATGTGPDWTLEIRNGNRLEFTAEWRDTHIGVNAPPPIADGDEAVYRANAKSGDVEVRISNVACDPADGTDMRGSMVTVRTPDRVFEGCGRPLH